jgi:hypothetical protein
VKGAALPQITHETIYLSPKADQLDALAPVFLGLFAYLFVFILTGISFAGGTTLKRPLEMSGDEVTIKFPPTTNQQGQQTSTHVTLRRLSGEAAMIPARDRVQ